METPHNNKQNSADRTQGLRYFAYFRTLCKMKMKRLLILIIPSLALISCGHEKQNEQLSSQNDNFIKEDYLISTENEIQEEE